MKRLIIFGVLFFSPSVLLAFPSIVQSSSCWPCSGTLSFNSNVTPGNFLAISIACGDVSASVAATDTLGQTFSVAINNYWSSLSTLAMLYFANSSGGPDTVTETGCTTNTRMHLIEYSNDGNTIVLDTTSFGNCNSGTGSCPTTSKTTAYNNEIALCSAQTALGVDDWTITSPFYSPYRLHVFKLWESDDSLSATGSIQCTLAPGTAANSQVILASFGLIKNPRRAILTEGD